MEVIDGVEFWCKWPKHRDANLPPFFVNAERAADPFMPGRIANNGFQVAGTFRNGITSLFAAPPAHANLADDFLMCIFLILAGARF